MLIGWSIENLRVDWYIYIYIYKCVCVVSVWVVEMRKVVVCAAVFESGSVGVIESSSRG